MKLITLQEQNQFEKEFKKKITVDYLNIDFQFTRFDTRVNIEIEETLDYDLVFQGKNIYLEIINSGPDGGVTSEGYTSIDDIKELYI